MHLKQSIAVWRVPWLTEHEWLFMLYLSGDNNLSSEMAWTINEIGDAFKAAQDAP